MAVAGHQVEEGPAIGVIGEDAFPVVATVHEVEAGFVGPLAAARGTWHLMLPMEFGGRAAVGAVGAILSPSLELSRIYVERHHFSPFFPLI